MGNKMLENLLCSLVAGNEFEKTDFETHLSIFICCLSICQAVATFKLTLFHSSVMSLPF